MTSNKGVVNNGRQLVYMHTYPCISPTYSMKSELSLYEQKVVLSDSIDIAIIAIVILLPR